MEDFKILQKYHELLRPHRAAFFSAFGFCLGMSLIGLVTPMFVRVLFDYAYPYRNLGLLNLVVGAIVVAWVIYFFLGAAADYIRIYVYQEAVASLTEKVFGAVQRLPVEFHRDRTPGDLLSRIISDVEKTVCAAINALPTMIIDGGRFLIILAIAIYLSPKLTVMALICVPLYAFEIKFCAERRLKAVREIKDANEALSCRAEERLANITTIKAFSQERPETLSFLNFVGRRYLAGVKGDFLEMIRMFAGSVTLRIWGVLLLWYLGYLVIRGETTIGAVIALIIYFEQLGESVRRVMETFAGWKMNAAAMKRIEEVLNAQVCTESEEARAGNISFSCLPGETVLHDLEISFPPKSISAIVGAGGYGKNAFVDLIGRFLKPGSIAILIKGPSISEIRLHPLNGQTRMIVHDAALFEGSIIWNILYGNEGLERGDAMNAARMVGAAGFIENLPGKYDTQVGLGGCFLSGSERRCIAIARMLLRNPSIIIFDESEESQDAVGEYHTHDLLTKLKQTKTVIVMTNRVAVMKYAEVIFVVENGKFVENGSFESLLEKRGAFYRLYWKQFGDLASFNRQLTLEFERTKRYGSRFCVAMLRARGYLEIRDKCGIEAAGAFMDSVEDGVKKLMRIGDNCAKQDGDVVLLLLPEITCDQLVQFFKRMRMAVLQVVNGATGKNVEGAGFVFAGTCVTKAAEKSPEDLLSALREKLDRVDPDRGFEIIAEDFLGGN
jgi:ABC-type bacteriocin/lantibiotic exporter with double-glycine peptidase domain